MDRRSFLSIAAAVASAIPFRSRAAIGLLRGAISPIQPRQAVLNPSGIFYYDNQQAFLNPLKQAATNVPVYSAWSTQNSGGSDTSEEAYLEQILDANGYPTTLTLTTPPSGGQQFVKLNCSTLKALTAVSGVTYPYPAGNRRFRFQGKGTFVIGGDFSVPSQTPPSGVTISGNQVTSANAWGTNNDITLSCTTPSSAGFSLTTTALPDSSNYLKGMSLVESAYTTAFDGGQIFHPLYLAWLQSLPQNTLTMRFMDMLATNIQCYLSQYLSYNFSSAPTSGNPLPALAAAWPNQSGQRRITLSTGEELLATFATGSTTVTSTTNPTLTASNGYFIWFAYDSFSARSNVGDLTYATQRGMPFEICIALATAVNANAWLCVPWSYQSADWANLASLIQSNVTTGQKVYIEPMNEIWNGGAFAATASYGQWKSEKLWGVNDSASYTGMIAAQIADEMEATMGSSAFFSTIVPVLPGQAANTAVLTSVITTPHWTGNTPPWQRANMANWVPAIAPYVGNGALYAADYTHMSGEGDGGYSDFFAQLTSNPVGGYTYHDWNGNALPSGGFLGIATTWVANHVSLLASYGSPTIHCYEGGTQFDTNGTQETFMYTADVDPRMGTFQYTYLVGIAAAGAVPAQLNFSNPHVNGDTWGLIQTPLQTESPLASAPPRWQGFYNYVSGS